MQCGRYSCTLVKLLIEGVEISGYLQLPSTSDSSFAGAGLGSSGDAADRNLSAGMETVPPLAFFINIVTLSLLKPMIWIASWIDLLSTFRPLIWLRSNMIKIAGTQDGMELNLAPSDIGRYRPS